MYVFTSHLTTYLLLMHLVLGCCFHHAHACVNASCPQPMENQPTENDSGCGCAHRTDSGDVTDQIDLHSELARPTPDRQHRHQCEGDHCRFVVAKRLSEQDRGTNIAAWSTSVAFERHRSNATGKTLAAGNVESCTVSGFSLRAHLRLSVLLI